MELQILGNQSFTILVLMSVAVTALVSPLLKAVVRPSKRLVFYKRRTIWWPNPDSELRLLTCVHVPRQVPGLIALLDIAHPTKRSPIFVYALHLIELTGRTSAILLNAAPADASPSGNQHNHSHGRIQAQSDHIFHAFESYDQYAGGVSIQFLTAISPYATMHEDVISAAEDRHAALILLPFHKHHTVDGGMHPNHPACRAINQSVLSAAPCSVGILVDRGLGGHRATRRITLLFFGGPDDREALALASRMAGHPAIDVTVLRFVHAARAHSQSGSPKTERVVTVSGEAEERDWRVDEECVGEFRERWGGGVAEYEERVVSNAEETVAVIRGVDGIQDMYVVGRGHGKESPLTAGLTDWSECPELGAIGDLLASPDFGTTASVLVLQQGKGGAPADAMMEPKGRVYMNKADHHRASKQIPGTRVYNWPPTDRYKSDPQGGSYGDPHFHNTDKEKLRRREGVGNTPIYNVNLAIRGASLGDPLPTDILSYRHPTTERGKSPRTTRTPLSPVDASHLPRAPNPAELFLRV
ncbi:hypothetical protein GW17_00029714 [Ensete ventricosum]|nr:hypothetical protein GW17_00029714 [Ensete ventricosum]